MGALHVRTLCEMDIERAYPLVRSATRLTCAEWRDVARGAAGSGGGVLVVCDEADDVCYGAAAFRPRENKRAGRTLDVAIFVAIELTARPLVRRMLLSALADAARRHRATAPPSRPRMAGRTPRR